MPDWRNAFSPHVGNIILLYTLIEIIHHYLCWIYVQHHPVWLTENVPVWHNMCLVSLVTTPV